MKYQKRESSLDNKNNELSIFKTKSWIEDADEVSGTCNTKSQIKFKTAMVNSILYDFSDEQILVKETITITGAGSDVTGRNTGRSNRKVIFKNCAPFTECISK